MDGAILHELDELDRLECADDGYVIIDEVLQILLRDLGVLLYSLYAEDR